MIRGLGAFISVMPLICLFLIFRLQRDRHRGSTYAQPRMSGPVNGIDTVTKSMERVSIQPLMAINPAGNSCNQDEEEWD